MEEFNFLINILNNCAKRPGMYGNPENLETLSKHITHICLTITKSDWLSPLSLARNQGYRPNELKDIETIIQVNLQKMLNIWEREKQKLP